MRPWCPAILLVALASSSATAQFGGPPLPLQAAPPGQRADAAYVVSVISGEVAVIRPEPPEVIGTIHVAGNVRRFTAARDGSWVAAVSTATHVVTLVDTRTMAEPIVLRAERSPMACAFHPDDRELWVTFSSGAVRIYRHADAAGWAEAAAVEGLEGADDLLMSSDGATCFVATRAGVALVDVATRRLRATARTKRGSDRMVPSPDGRRLYVRNGLIETVYAIDTRDGSVQADLEMNAGIRDLALSPDGSLLYVSTYKDPGPAGPAFTKGTGEGAVEIVDCAKHELLVPIRTRGLTGSMATDAAGKTLFLAHESDGVQVIDTGERRVVNKLSAPPGPFLLASWPGRDLVLALNATRTMLISGGERKFTASVTVPKDAPLAVCFAGMGDSGGRAFLTKPATPSSRSQTAPGAAVAPPPAPKSIPFDLSGAKGTNPDKKGATGDRFPPSLQTIRTDDLTDAERRRVTPPPVTLQFKDVPPRRVVDELIRQTGIDLLTAPDLFAKHRDPVTVDVRAQEFWPALAELGPGAGLWATLSDNLPLTLASAPPQEDWVCPPLVSGPFLLRASRPNDVGGEQFDLLVRTHPDPRVWVMAGARFPSVTEAVDENGKPFVVRPPGTPGTLGRDLWVHFTRPRGGGRKLARVAGAGHLYVVVGADQHETSRFATSNGGECTVGGLRLRLDRTQLEPARGRGFPAWHSMRITLLRDGLENRAWEQARNLFEASRLVLRGQTGQWSYQELTAREDVADGLAVMVRSPANLPDPWLGPPADRLVIEVPTRIVEVDVPFLFEDIALPERKKPAPN